MSHGHPLSVAAVMKLPVLDREMFIVVESCGLLRNVLQSVGGLNFVARQFSLNFFAIMTIPIFRDIISSITLV